jgi:hypothetical protein
MSRAHIPGKSDRKNEIWLVPLVRRPVQKGIATRTKILHGKTCAYSGHEESPESRRKTTEETLHAPSSTLDAARNGKLIPKRLQCAFQPEHHHTKRGHF